MYNEYGMDSRVVDKTEDIEMIFYDTFNFNNIFQSGLLIFQTMTLEGWSVHLYNYQDATNPAGAAIYFIFVVIIGSWVTLNLVLAQIMHSFI